MGHNLTRIFLFLQNNLNKTNRSYDKLQNLMTSFKTKILLAFFGKECAALLEQEVKEISESGSGANDSLSVNTALTLENKKPLKTVRTKYPRLRHLICQKMARSLMSTYRLEESVARSVSLKVPSMSNSR